MVDVNLETVDIESALNHVAEIEHAADAIKEILFYYQHGTKTPPAVATSGIVTSSKLIWTETMGKNGPFEICKQTSEPEFQELLKSMEPKGSKFEGGLFYWIFMNRDAIGRKKTKPKA